MTKEEFLKYPFTGNTWAVVDGEHNQIEKVDYIELSISTTYYVYIDCYEIEKLYEKQPESIEELKEPSEIEQLREEVNQLRRELFSAGVLMGRHNIR